MKLIVMGLKRTSPFIYILAALLLFYMVFNLNYQWFGISLIVRIYIYLFCFYLIFNFSSINIDLYEEVYKTRFGRHAEQVLFYKARVVPFMIILGTIVLFGLIDGIGQPNWPWRPLVEVMEGRHFILMVYSLFLLFVLKQKKDPGVTIPIFLAMCVGYFFLDMAIETVLRSGAALVLTKYLKWLIFFFFLFLEFYVRRNPLKLLTTAAVVALVTGGLYAGSVVLVFRNAPAMSYLKKETGIQLLRLGFAFPLTDMRAMMMESPDPDLFATVTDFAGEYRYDLRCTQEECERLLFSGSVEMAERVSEYLADKNISVPYEKIMAYAAEKSGEPESKIMGAHSFIRLAAASLPGNEHDFEARLRTSGRRFVQWGIAVIAEQKNIAFMPLLMELLTDIDPGTAEAAYIALMRITGTDPREKLNRRINDAAVVVFFRDYYLQNRKGN